MEIEGTWKLVTWRRIAPDGSVSFPLGPDPEGQLTYTSDGYMSVVLVSASRPPIAGGDPLGGDIEARAEAYSTCLAYTGTYVRDEATVIHYIEQSLYPNWSDTKQPRLITDRDGQLVLTTPSQAGMPTTVNEIVWARPS
ncbi:MAG: lipocalin-like domain-containing protein [Pseudonocardia sp.]|nr:lipocalin-like domain-containing protein [Pseudonocardia sp.]